MGKRLTDKKTVRRAKEKEGKFKKETTGENGRIQGRDMASNARFPAQHGLCHKPVTINPDRGTIQP